MGQRRGPIPGTYVGPPACRVRVGKGHCGKPAFNWVKTTIEIMGRKVRVRYPFCDSHFNEVKENDVA